MKLYLEKVVSYCGVNIYIRTSHYAKTGGPMALAVFLLIKSRDETIFDFDNIYVPNWRITSPALGYAESALRMVEEVDLENARDVLPVTKIFTQKIFDTEFDHLPKKATRQKMFEEIELGVQNLYEVTFENTPSEIEAAIRDGSFRNYNKTRQFKPKPIYAAPF